MKSLPWSNILIATFSPWIDGKRLPINGNLEPLLDFFVPKLNKTVLIDQVYPGSDTVIPRIEVYERGIQKITHPSVLLHILYPFLKLINASNPGETHVLYKIRDFFSVLDWGLRDKTQIDLFIGLESINALAGIILKKIGKIKTVVYYVSDYSPKRYPSSWFNRLYLWLDRYSATHADYIWDVSPAMQPARIAAGLDPKRSAPVIHVPNALYPSQIKQAPLRELKPYSLVFMGTLGRINGPDLAIEALSYVLRRFSQVKLHIVGGNNIDEKRLIALVARLKLKRQVIFHGFIDDRERISKTIRQFAVALAPYPAIPGSARFYGDATKIRAYLAAGLPTITTVVPPLGKEAEAAGAALIVKDNPKALADAIIEVFLNQSLFLKLRKNAIRFARNNTWENEFNRAIAQMSDEGNRSLTRSRKVSRLRPRIV